MQLEALGYVGIRADKLEDWASFGTGYLGMQLVDKSRNTLAFRMDDRKQRVIVDADTSAGMGFFGWEVANGAALDALAARLEQNAVPVARASRALAEQRRVRDLIVLRDPLGNRLEVFHDAETTAEPFVPGRAISGFRTGPLGMGHAVLTVEKIDDVIPFYRDLLGFRLSDYVLKPFKAFFFHVNPRHHSLAFLETGRNGMHHLMVELFSLDDVGQAYDLALGEEGRIGVTLGRHINDHVTSFYSWTPSGFMVEYGWGGRTVDDATWQPGEVTYGPSMWGHDRVWLSPEDRTKARDMRLKAAAEGVCEPVQVMLGNHNLMTGVCPWWDEQVRGKRPM